MMHNIQSIDKAYKKCAINDWNSYKKTFKIKASR